MKEDAKLLFTIVALVLLTGKMPAHSGDTVDVKYGTTPVINGTLSNGEWDDADTVTFTTANGEVTAYFKQDAASFFVGLDIPDTDPDFDDSGVAIDLSHDGGPTSEDLFLELSRNGDKRERHGTDPYYNDYQTPTGWEAAYSTSSTGWQVEYDISFEKIEITSGTPKTLGVAFHTLDGFTAGEVDWPPTVNILDPDTYADMLSSDNWGIPNMVEELDPLSNNVLFSICFPSTIRYLLPAASHVKLTIYDATGREVAALVDRYQTSGNHSITWDAEGASHGVYFVSIQSEEYSQTQKLLLLR